VSASAYLPADGVVALDDDHLAALVDCGQGLRMAASARAWFAAAGALTVDGEGDRDSEVLDPPLRPIAVALGGDGPRLRLRSLRAGTTTVADVVLPPPGDLSPGGAVLAVRTPGPDGVTHLRHITRGGAARHLLRRVGVGPHVLAVPPEAAVALPPSATWADVRAAFAGPVPSGWASGARRAELHEVLWSAGRGRRPATAWAVANLDGALCAVAPDRDDPRTYAVGPADTRLLWQVAGRLVRP
jgi:hypothetical protein